jgi:hypothetical protein
MPVFNALPHNLHDARASPKRYNANPTRDKAQLAKNNLKSPALVKCRRVEIFPLLCYTLCSTTNFDL